MSPKISVIIPTYNRESVLLRAIKSVAFQTYQNFELIIIDDGSTDNSREIVDDYFFENKLDHQMYRYFNIKNSGVSYARNIGAKFARGEWLSFLDSDDEWLPNKLERQIKLFEENPHLKIIHGDEIWIRNGVRVNQMKKHQKYGGDIFLKCLPLCLISPSAVMLKKDLFFSVGMFREDFPVCEDYDLWLKITLNNEVGFIDDFLIKKYGGHEDQLSHKLKSMDYFRVIALFDILEKNKEIEQDKKEKVIEEIKLKSHILIQGMEKHQNFEYYDEVKKITERLKFL